MAFRGTATATALALAWATAVGCSSRAQGTHGAPDTVATTPASAPASPTAAAASDANAKITQAAFNEDTDGARVVLSANAPLLYTSYEPRPDLLIVDLRDATVADGFRAPVAAGSVVESIKFEELDELGKRITRLSIAHQPDATVDVRSVGQGLAIAFTSTASVSSADASNAPASPPEPAPAEVVASAPLPSPPAQAPTAPPASAAVRGELAHTLESVVAEVRDGYVAVILLGDGWFAPKDFVLANPPRVVLDLPGVKNEVSQRSISVKGDHVSRVRVSQFQTSPEYVTRVVVDLTQPMAHAVVADGERLSVLIGSDLPTAAEPATAVASAPPVEPAPAAAPPAPAPEPSVTTIAYEPAAPPMEEAAPAPATRVAETPAPVQTAAVVAPPAPPPAAEPAPRVVEPPPAPAPVAVKPVVPEPAPVAQAAVPPPAPARQAPAPPKPSSSRGDALFEAAAAALDQEQAQNPGSSYRSRTISEAPTQFTGEPISLDLKDADIKDVFRTISQLTGLNIVIDPDVRGTVTVQLEDVPWDQALDLILKQNGLGYVLENNIMRIATTAKLQAEEGDRARLAEARQAAEPTRTVIKKLSYAKAAEITPTLQSVMSKRGSIVVDARTNTLIIREIPTYLPAVLQLIDNLDTATPQVVIESRIVETTKSLGRSLGINWAVRGKADTESGNTTNLIFPNTIRGGLDIGLGNGPTVASLVLGNILNTFNLDIALTAAENQGLLKIISSPKVTSLTNTAALIQSGVQIPVQTTVNNTTTVIYVDATLKLDVTPQITAEGTILLTVNVTKREPAVALNLSLGQNVPLTIREYRGQVLVKDGGTTVIGGIFQINDQDQYNMIPGLWKIPILGNLFKNKTRTEKHDELLIFITPRILRS
jgi:type IV pilus assembly protein PilQ